MQKFLDHVGNQLNDRLLKQSFFYTFLLGLAAHAWCFLNLSISHDSLRAFYIAGKYPKASLGRIFYAAYISLTRGKIVLPWLIGVLALFWLSIVVYLICQLFQMEKRVFVLLTAGICVTNPSLYATAATYLHDLDANAFAILLAVLSVYLWNHAMKGQKRRYLFLGLAALLLSFALGIYQSYLSVAITMIILVSIKNLLEGKKGKEVFENGLQAIGMIVLTAVLYLLEVKLFTQVTGISILNNESYNGLGNMSSIFSGNIFEKVMAVYASFITPFKNLILTSEPQLLMLAVQAVLATGLLLAVFFCIRKLRPAECLLFAVLGVLMPFGMNISSFLSNGMYHVLMQYAVWFVYLLALLLVRRISLEKNISECMKKILGIAVVFCIFFTIAENIQTSNTIYVKKSLEAQATMSYMTRVADRMEETEAYIPGETPVVFIGEYAVGNSLTGFEKYEVITGVEYTSPITFYDTYKDYFRYILGRPVLLEDAGAFEKDERVIQMSVFPEDGSIEMLDGTLVVKLK